MSRGYCGQCGQIDAGVHTCSPQSSARPAPKVYAVCQSCGADTQWGRVHTCSPQVAFRTTLHGAPRTKKTSNRLVRAGPRSVVLPSKAWVQWRDALKEQWGKALAANVRYAVNVRAVFYRDAERGDAVGYYQGLADVLQALGVVADDKWIVSWDGSRLRKDAKNPRVEVEVTRANPDD